MPELNPTPANVLETGDGLTLDRELAIEAARHTLIATKVVLGAAHPLGAETLNDSWLLELAVNNLAYLLGGDHWSSIASELIDTVLEQEVTA